MRYLSAATVILAAVAAAFAQLPYPWAHTAALAVSAGIAGLHLSVPFPATSTPLPSADQLTAAYDRLSAELDRRATAAPASTATTSPPGAPGVP